jgi:hypothetical protein
MPPVTGSSITTSPQELNTITDIIENELDIDSVVLPEKATNGLSQESVSAMRANVAYANQGIETAGRSIRAVMAALSSIKADLTSVKKTKNWTALTESGALNMSGRMARDLTVAWDTWVRDTDVPDSTLVKISARTQAKIGTAEAGKRIHAINKIKKDGKFTDQDLSLIARKLPKLSTDALLEKAERMVANWTDDEKVAKIGDFVLENITLKAQVAELKEQLAEAKKGGYTVTEVYKANPAARAKAASRRGVKA